MQEVDNIGAANKETHSGSILGNANYSVKMTAERS